MRVKLFSLTFVFGLLAAFTINGLNSAHAGYNEESKVESARAAREAEAYSPCVTKTIIGLTLHLL